MLNLHELTSVSDSDSKKNPNKAVTHPTSHKWIGYIYMNNILFKIGPVTCNIMIMTFPTHRTD